jgi:hypothetical protein
MHPRRAEDLLHERANNMLLVPEVLDSRPLRSHVEKNFKSISHRCHLFEVALVWELTKENIHLPLGWTRLELDERPRLGG